MLRPYVGYMNTYRAVYDFQIDSPVKLKRQEFILYAMIGTPLYLRAECAAANRAIGIRKGEQLT